VAAKLNEPTVDDSGTMVPLVGDCLPGWHSPERKNILTKRPYYIIPFGDPRYEADRSKIRDDILERIKSGQNDKPISDIYVLSHGWHRNLFAGVSAYDRLVSRLFVLLARGRIDPGEFGNPLFLAIHWNSDPEPDAWIDRGGRRDKDSFLANARALFVPRDSPQPSAAMAPEVSTESAKDRAVKAPGIDKPAMGLRDVHLAQFTTDMESIFALMSKISAPDTPMAQSEITAQSLDLLSQLEYYEVAGLEIPATPEAKVSTIWRCYFEAQPKGFLVDQSDAPKAVGWTWTNLTTLLKYVIGIVGFGFAITGLKSGISKYFVFPKQQIANDWSNPLHKFHLPSYDGKAWLSIVVAAVVGYLLLWLAVIFREGTKNQRSAKGFPPQTVGWLPTQLLVTTPALLFLLLTYLFRSWMAVLSVAAIACGWYTLGIGTLIVLTIMSLIASSMDWRLSGVFREKLKAPGDHAVNVRDYLVGPARHVISLLIRSVPEDSAVYRIVTTLDNQLAFFKMQRDGTEAGCQVGGWIHDLAVEVGRDPRPRPEKIRLHAIGHSFGALVVQNAVRTCALTIKGITSDQIKGMKRRFWAQSMQTTRPMGDVDLPFELQTICLIQGASASDWFRYEEETLSRVTGTIACIYSGYDTANGVLYPLANNGRMAAGYVGLCNLGGGKHANGTRVPFRQAVSLGGGGDFALLIEPPSLSAVAMTENKFVPTDIPRLLNLDASRIVYQGSIPLGGGHDDIFKDDVIHLAWAACHYR